MLLLFYAPEPFSLSFDIFIPHSWPPFSWVLTFPFKSSSAKQRVKVAKRVIKIWFMLSKSSTTVVLVCLHQVLLYLPYVGFTEACYMDLLYVVLRSRGNYFYLFNVKITYQKFGFKRFLGSLLGFESFLVCLLGFERFLVMGLAPEKDSQTRFSHKEVGPHLPSKFCNCCYLLPGLQVMWDSKKYI